MASERQIALDLMTGKRGKVLRLVVSDRRKFR